MQPLTAIPRLAKLPFGLQTIHTDRHCAIEKQPAKEVLFVFNVKDWIVYSCSRLTIKSSVIGSKTSICRASPN